MHNCVYHKKGITASILPHDVQCIKINIMHNLTYDKLQSTISKMNIAQYYFKNCKQTETKC